jgi:psiF repeat
VKSIAVAVVLGLSLTLSTLSFADDSNQQARMGACNKEAGDRKGDARKSFMQECLSGAHVTGKITQQERMANCNRQAEGKKGDERKSFMSTCLRN